jgi:hypothetical protein
MDSPAVPALLGGAPASYLEALLLPSKQQTAKQPPLVTQAAGERATCNPVEKCGVPGASELLRAADVASAERRSGEPTRVRKCERASAFPSILLGFGGSGRSGGRGEKATRKKEGDGRRRG